MLQSVNRSVGALGGALGRRCAGGIGVVVAWGLGLGAMAPGQVRAAVMVAGDEAGAGEGMADDGDGGLPGSIRVDVAPTIADAELYPGWIYNRNPEIEQDFPEASGHEQWIAVVLEGETYDYRVRVTAMRDGEPVGTAKEFVACECTNDELMGLVDEGIADALEQLRVLPAETATDDVGEPAVAAIDEDPAKVDRPRRLGPLGYTGIGLVVLGAGALAGGIPLALREPTPNLAGESDAGTATLTLVSTRPPGIAMAVGGGAVLLAGAALLIADRVKRRSATAVVVPTVGPRLVGASVSVGF